MISFPKRSFPSENFKIPFLSDEGYFHFEKWYTQTYADGLIPVEVVDELPMSNLESEITFADSGPMFLSRALRSYFSNGVLATFIIAVNEEWKQLFSSTY